MMALHKTYTKKSAQCHIRKLCFRHDTLKKINDFDYLNYILYNNSILFECLLPLKVATVDYLPPSHAFSCIHP